MPPAAIAAKAGMAFQSAHLRPMVSRFGGLINESNAIHIPSQSWEKGKPAPTDTAFEARHKPEQSNVYAGIPGYAGYKPHGSHPGVIGRQAAPPSHFRTMSSLDRTKHPYVMPVVGYSGHLPSSKDSYGTTHWKNSGGVNVNNKSAAATGWDNRDSAGRAHAGQTPGDFGTYEVDPEYEKKAKEAAEANEILELRSMGIRALMKKQPNLGGSYGPTISEVHGRRALGR